MNNASAIVALTRCPDYEGRNIAAALRRQFEIAGGIEKFVKPGDRVLLKPNLIAPKPRGCAAQTDPAVILETAKLLLDVGTKPFVGDSPAWANIFTCAKVLGLDEPLRKLSVPLKQLNKPKSCVLGSGRTKVAISSIALDADVIINLPKFKTHQQLGATFAVKNMFGCVCGKQKAFWHFAKGGKAADFCELLIEVYKFLRPSLTIIDAVTAMDGPGPINGRPRPLGFLIGGTDPVALEYVCAAIAGIEPDQLPIVARAKQLNWGCPNREQIEIRGESLAQAKVTDFQPADLIPVRFSLPRVCKSVIKQLLLLAKGEKQSQH